MPRKNYGLLPWQQGSRPLQQNGFVMMIVIILVSAISSIVVITTSLSSISHLESGALLEGTLHAEYGAEGCVSEALIQLSRDSGYTGRALSLGAVSCNITVSGTDNARSILIIGSFGNYIQEWIINVSLNPFIITSWTVNP